MNQEVRQNPITAETCFVPGTHKGKGRRTAVAPGSTAARYLPYGRITLGAEDTAEKFSNYNPETGLICLQGKATVTTGGQRFGLDRYDPAYVPRHSDIDVKPNGAAGCDIT